MDEHPGQASDLLKRVLRIDPANISAMNGLGFLAGEKGDFPAAVQQFENSLRIKADQPLIWFNHGLILAKAGMFQEALASFDHMLALDPNFGAGRRQRATTLMNLERYQEALDEFAVAERLLPGDPISVKERGLAWQHCRQFDQALKAYDRALAMDPNHADAWVCKAYLKLTLGDLPGGFPHFEWRWRTASLRRLPQKARRHDGTTLWLGETDIAGKTILIWGEGGFGDEIQFCRYATLAARRGARVIVETSPGLAKLMSTLEGASLVITPDDPLPDHDLQCPMMSLPLAFGTTLETIPGKVPNLYADAIRASQWHNQLSHLQGPRVGLVWGAGTRIGDAAMVALERQKSIPLRAFAPLVSVSGCSFVSIQLGPAAKQVPPPGLILHDDTQHINDFADTAALVENLDLVISVDTAVAHLAGAMGKSVWLLNRFDTDWRWFLDREDSPWYPTMRIFRQPRPGDWASPVQRVAEALREFVAA